MLPAQPFSLTVERSCIEVTGVKWLPGTVPWAHLNSTSLLTARSTSRAPCMKRCEITEHIEIFYNCQRRHSRLGESLTGARLVARQSSISLSARPTDFDKAGRGVGTGAALGPFLPDRIRPASPSWAIIGFFRDRQSVRIEVGNGECVADYRTFLSACPDLTCLELISSIGLPHCIKERTFTAMLAP